MENMTSIIDEIKIIQLGKYDVALLQELLLVFQNVFEMEAKQLPPVVYLTKLLELQKVMVLVIMSNNKVVGGLTAYELPSYYTQTSEMFIYDIAITPNYQRQGLGKQLVVAFKAYCKENGIPEFFVLAHESDTHALDFYRSLGGRAERVVNFVF